MFPEELHLIKNESVLRMEELEKEKQVLEKKE